MPTVSDGIVAPQVEDVIANSHLYGWEFEQVDNHRFRVTLTAITGDDYQVEVDYTAFPGLPPAFHWRNKETGELDQLASSPNSYNYFHSSGRICAPWNRLASEEGGPHLEWVFAEWQSNPYTKGTTTLSAMILRIQTELRSESYCGRQQ